MVILEGLDAVPWQHLDTFFGSPGEMPDLLRAVAQQLQRQPVSVGDAPPRAEDADGDDAEIWEATEEPEWRTWRPGDPEEASPVDSLFEWIHHQADLCAATPYAVPFIYELATHPAIEDRLPMVYLLADLGRVATIYLSYDPGVLRPEVHRLAEQTLQALREKRALIAPLLNDGNADIRNSAQELLEAVSWWRDVQADSLRLEESIAQARRGSPPAPATGSDG